MRELFNLLFLAAAGGLAVLAVLTLLINLMGRIAASLQSGQQTEDGQSENFGTTEEQNP